MAWHSEVPSVTMPVEEFGSSTTLQAHDANCWGPFFRGFTCLELRSVQENYYNFIQPLVGSTMVGHNNPKALGYRIGYMRTTQKINSSRSQRSTGIVVGNPHSTTICFRLELFRLFRYLHLKKKHCYHILF
jgi:hypothetical protein